MGNNKAWAWESPGFAHKKRLCQHFDTTSIKIHIKYEFEFDLKLSSLIRRCFSLSANQVKRMFEDGIITISGNKPPQKHKVKDGDMILIQREGLSKSINRSIHDIR